MSGLQKTREVEEDLIGIWHYTAARWGSTQADKYLYKIEACFKSIGRGRSRLRNLTDNIQYIRCGHHYIFLLAGKKPIIIAVLHEKMDLLARIKKRLR